VSKFGRTKLRKKAHDPRSRQPMLVLKDSHLTSRFNTVDSRHLDVACEVVRRSGEEERRKKRRGVHQTRLGEKVLKSSIASAPPLASAYSYFCSKW
jgi:hypothetical protein